TRARVDASVRVASVSTGNARRDAHLLAPDFFDAERHPTLRLTADRVEALDRAAGRGRLVARLTVRGVTRAAPLDLAYDARGLRGERLRVAATARVNRRDFGLTWNTLPIGVKDDVTITLDLEAART